MTVWLMLAALLASDPGGGPAAPGGGPTAPPPGREVRYLKGQLHLHSNRSGDSDTPPSDVVRWYAAHGYDFIVFTDHNRITAPASTSSMLVIPGVELTQNSNRCTPAAPPGRKCLLHVNALFVTPPALGLIPWGLPASSSRAEIYRRAILAARRMGGLAQLNHPNFHYGADGPLVAALAQDGLTLLEIANQSWDSNDTPDDKGRPTSEAIWDAALTAGATLYGTATDDAHHYFDAQTAAARGEPVFTGDLGFVMVRARKDPAAIRDALARGDFYASTGVLLARSESDGRALTVEVDPRWPGRHRFTFIGAGGRIVGTSEGRAASFPLAGLGGGYLRAVVTDGAGHRAWTQPIRLAPR
jgi:hypothetical protein